MEIENPLFAEFSLQGAHTCVRRCVLYKGRDQGFAEPGALLSTSPTDLPLPRTALRESFVLLASRARRSGNLRFGGSAPQGHLTTERPQIANDRRRMSTRHVVVTGAGTGIGRAIAIRQARDGATVGLVGLRAGRARGDRRGDRRPDARRGLRRPRPRGRRGGVRRALPTRRDRSTRSSRSAASVAGTGRTTRAATGSTTSSGRTSTAPTTASAPRSAGSRRGRTLATSS